MEENSKVVKYAKVASSPVVVAHACNSSYSGGKYQKYHRLKAALANSS
jgi:hypothetical protein